MSGHISKESWSRCEQPSMLYDTVRNPAAPRVPAKASAVLASGKDTIETVQQRLNRQMLERLHSKGNHLPHDSFVAVVQVGKYLFLAVMLPPYLCFYGLPKWILLQLLPQLTEIVKQVAFRGGQIFLDLSKRMIDLMKGMIDQTIGYSLRTNKDRFRRAWERIASVFNLGTDTLKSGLKKLSEAVKTIKQKLSDQFAGTSEFFLSIGKNASEKFKSAFSALIDPVASFSAKLGKSLKQTFQANTNRFLSPMGEAFVKASQQVEAAKQKIVSAIKKVTEPISAKISEVGYKITGSAAILFDPVMVLAKETYEKAADTINKARKAVEDQVKAVASAVQTHAAAFLATVADQVRYAWQIVPMALNGIGKQASRIVPKRVKDRFAGKKEAYQKWKGYTGRVAAGAGNGVKEVAAFAGKGIASGLDGLIQLLKLLFTFIRRAVVQALALPKHLFKAFGNVLKASAYVLSRLGFTLQILIALVWALCLYSAYLVSSAGNRVIKTT